MPSNEKQKGAEKHSPDHAKGPKSTESGNWGSSDSDGQNDDETGETGGRSTNANSTNGNTKGDPTR